MLHLLDERFAVVFHFDDADAAAGGQHVAVLVDVVQRGRFAEAGDAAATSVCWGKVVDEVLNPDAVRIADRRRTELPADVVAE